MAKKGSECITELVADFLNGQHKHSCTRDAAGGRLGEIGKGQDMAKSGP